MKMLPWLLLSGILLFPALFFSKDRMKPREAQSTVNDTVTAPALSKADSIISFAKKYLGTPYKYGSCDPKTGFDCSGFTYYVFRKAAGIELPRSSRDLNSAGHDVDIKNCRKGDLILFRGTNPNDKSIGHVGIIISEEGQPVEFIHSSSSKKHWGVVISDMEKDYYTKRFVKIKRVL
jgi:cell wall-associated NlpC family hydrolase